MTILTPLGDLVDVLGIDAVGGMAETIPQTPDDGSDQPLSLPEELRTGPPGARSELDLDLATAGADGARRVRATRLPLAGDEGGALLLIEDRTRSAAGSCSPRSIAATVPPQRVRE